MSFESRVWKGFNLVYHSIHSDDYLWFLILRGKQKRKKLNYTRVQSSSPFSLVRTKNKSTPSHFLLKAFILLLWVVRKSAGIVEVVALLWASLPWRRVARSVRRNNHVLWRRTVESIRTGGRWVRGRDVWTIWGEFTTQSSSIPQALPVGSWF